MSGLREKQKADRERRILEAAVTKFRADGYRAVRIEDLAEAANVSVGTIYNYYRNKGDILIATVAMEVEEVLASGAAIVSNPPSGAEKAVLALIYEYYDHSLNYLSKEMWRCAIALSIEASGTPNGMHYTELDRRLSQQVTDLIKTLQENGEVKRGLEAGAVGQLVFSGLNQVFIEFIKDEDMPLEELRRRVAAQIKPLLQMLATT
jgi:AcrR family transcriptional regulator